MHIKALLLLFGTDIARALARLGLLALSLVLVVFLLVVGVAASVAAPLLALGDEAAGPRAEQAVVDIPPAQLAAMRTAAQESCGPPWRVLAGIARVESVFDQNMETSSAGAVGYGQFLPSTWAEFGRDGDGDGDRDPYYYRDALPEMAAYLCAFGAPDDLHAAVYAYNHDDQYVAQVLGFAHDYGWTNPAVAAAPPETWYRYQGEATSFDLAHNEGSNCGPAAVAMGVQRATGLALPIRRIRSYLGTDGYTSLDQLSPVLGYQRAVGWEEAYLCEGVFDWLTAVSWGSPAFSPCGTHFPVARMGFLARARRVYGVLDGDEAGRRAAEEFGEQLDRRWVPVELPHGADLNDLGRDPAGRERFLALVGAAGEGGRGEGAHGA